MMSLESANLEAVSMDNTENVESLTFEQAMMELEKVVRQLEEGKLSLEESIQAFERGTVLRNHCEQKLRSAKMKVDQIVNVQEGTAVLKAFDPAAA